MPPAETSQAPRDDFDELAGAPGRDIFDELAEAPGQSSSAAQASPAPRVTADTWFTRPASPPAASQPASLTPQQQAELRAKRDIARQNIAQYPENQPPTGLDTWAGNSRKQIRDFKPKLVPKDEPMTPEEIANVGRPQRLAAQVDQPFQEARKVIVNPFGVASDADKLAMDTNSEVIAARGQYRKPWSKDDANPLNSVHMETYGQQLAHGRVGQAMRTISRPFRAASEAFSDARKQAVDFAKQTAGAMVDAVDQDNGIVFQDTTHQILRGAAETTAGTVADLATDPTNYLFGGAVKAAAKLTGAKLFGKALAGYFGYQGARAAADDWAEAGAALGDPNLSPEEKSSRVTKAILNTLMAYDAGRHAVTKAKPRSEGSDAAKEERRETAQSQSQPHPVDEPTRAMIEYERSTGNPDFQPPPAAPPARPQGPDHLTPTLVQQAAQRIAGLPEAQRGNAMVAAHQAMVRWMSDRLGQQFMGPDHELHTVRDRAEAEKLAMQFVNDEVRRSRQQEVDKPQPGAPPPEPAKPAPQQQAQPAKPVTEQGREQVGATDKDSGRTIVQPTTDPVENERLASEAAPQFATQLSRIADSVPGADFARVRPQKSLERVQEKAADGQPPETIGDYLAGQIAADSVEAKNRLIEELKKKYRVVDVDDKFLEGRPDKAGYPSANVQVELPNGLTAEIQIVPREVQEVTDYSHRYYTEGRNHPESSPERKAAWDKAEAINREALRRFKERNGGGSRLTRPVHYFARQVREEIRRRLQELDRLPGDQALNIAGRARSSIETHSDPRVPDIIRLNLEAMHILLRYLNNAPVVGIAMAKQSAAGLIAHLKKLSDILIENQRDAEAAPVRQMASHLQQTLGKQERVPVYLDTGDEAFDAITSREERGHVIQEQIDPGNEIVHADIGEQRNELWSFDPKAPTEFNKAGLFLEKRGYSYNPFEIVSEVAMKTLTGQGQYMGLSRPECQSVARKYLRALVRIHGPDAIGPLKVVADEEYHHIFDEVKGK